MGFGLADPAPLFANVVVLVIQALREHSGSSLQGGASFKAEKAHFAA